MRVTANVPSRAKRKKVLKRAKGFDSSRQLYRKAKETLLKAGAHAYRGRKESKRTFRRLWITRLSGALSSYDLSYSQFIGKLKKENIVLNRKVLSEIAINDPKTFEKVVKEVQK